MRRRRFCAAALAIVMGATAPPPAIGQSSSSRPVRFIVGLPPGGAVEPYARLISERMAKTLGRVTIVENRPGGNGNLAAQFVANAPADGNLIWVSTQAWMEINPSVYPDSKWSPTDFIPLIRGVEAPLVLVAHPSVPAKTLPELVAWIKSNPGKLNYSSYSPGTPSHFLGFQMNERFGLDLVHVPSRGSGLQTTDLVGAHVLFGFGQMQSTLPFINSGKLTAIAVTDGARSRFLPATPTFAELGLPDFTTKIWFGLMVRSGTPPALFTSLLNATKEAHADPDVKAHLEALGFDVSGQSGAEFGSAILAQAERWARLVRASGFKAESGQ